MKLYHGSNTTVDNPDTRHSRERLDFGKGFYLTSVKQQAESWALRATANSGGVPIVTTYEVLDDMSGFRTLTFNETNDREWVEFVCQCRRGSNEYAHYDIVIGGVADDKVYRAVDMYFRGYWDIETTLEALRFYDVNDQYCFITQRAINALLTYTGSYEVEP